LALANAKEAVVTGCSAFIYDLEAIIGAIFDENLVESSGSRKFLKKEKTLGQA